MIALISTLAALVAPPTPVVKVVVFPDRAQVTRAVDVQCGARRVVQFLSIPPSAERDSVRAQIDVGSVDGLRVEERPQTEAFSAEAREVEAAIEKVDGELRTVAEALDRAQEASRLQVELARTGVELIAREMSEPAPNVAAWRAALDAALKARLQAAAEAEKLAGETRRLRRKRAELERARARVQAASGRKTLVAEAVVSCPEGKSATLKLVYLVGGAGWTPSYAARAEKGTVALTTLATVTQSTGEDWRGVELVLSTALPRDRATPPEITPFSVYADLQKPPKKVIVGREEMRAHADAPTGATTPAFGGKNVAVVEEGLSVQLVVPERADVAGDGTPARIDVGRATFAAPLKLRSVPKLAPFVFRVAEVTNTTPVPLLAGPVDVFARGDFLARYELKRVAQGGRVDLSFGIEEAVKVRRIVVEELARDQGVLGPSRQRRFAYRFEVASFLDRTEEVEISEHIPVSELDDVTVKIDPRTTGGYQLRADDGIVTWRLTLKPGEKRTVELRYVIDVPASYDAGG
jgi:uncharacterized protein (TIGR02231 family)